MFIFTVVYNLQNGKFDLLSFQCLHYLLKHVTCFFFFTQDCYDVVQKTTLVILQRLQHVLQIEVLFSLIEFYFQYSVASQIYKFN